MSNCFIFYGASLLLQKTPSKYLFPKSIEVLAGSIDKQYSHKQMCIVFLSSDENISDDYELVAFRQLPNLLSSEQVKQAIYALQIAKYLNENQFCSVCGDKLAIDEKDSDAWLQCNVCVREIYPTIPPAMIVLIKRGENEVLLAKNLKSPPHAWGLVAGFCEVGESAEETVQREVMEEVGLVVNNIRYVESQFWPFPGSMMLGFVADYVSGDIVLDTTELADAGFFTRENIPGYPSTNYSIAAKLIKMWENREI